MRPGDGIVGGRRAAGFPAAHTLLSAVAAALIAATAVLAEGKPSLNVYFQTTLQDPAYQKKVFQKVVSVWRSPSSSAYPKAGAKAVVQAVVGRDGRLVSAFVSMESGSKAWDAAAIKGVEAAAPFEPLPSSFKEKTLEAHFHFSVGK